MKLILLKKSQDISVSIAIGYGQDDQMIGVRFLAGGWEIFSTPCPNQLRGPPSLLSNGYWGLFLGVKQLGCETDHSPLSSAKVKECMKLYLYSPIHLHGLVLS
jgi:hypothetical protein